ncbi:hypothetical protein P7M08_24350 [Vibrio parahaemolyticus]|nr:hypothetical protein [Vibrio parahaemolyticus]NMR87048.1 hypothetical protein [Vibrio parahaemolyticus]
MGNKKDLIKTLDKLKNILNIEKDALILNKTEIIETILGEKVKVIDNLNSFYLNTIEIDEDIKKSFSESIEMQKTNQMLTEQAISYQKNLMESIAKVLSKGNTYKKNGIENNDVSTFIDQNA